MKIHTLSRGEAENIEVHYPHLLEEDKVAIVSIGPPGLETADLDESLFDEVVRLHFHDADPHAMYEGTTAGMTLMDGKHASKVRVMIEEFEPDVLFVQCQAGVSRSCGMALAIHEHYNDGEMKAGWDNYNRYVYKLMKENLTGTTKDSEFYDDIFDDDS